MRIETINSNMHRKVRTEADFTGMSGYSSYSGISGYSSYSGLSGYVGRDGYAGQPFVFTQIGASSGWNVVHNLGEQGVVISIYDNSWNQIIPSTVRSVDGSSAYVTFPTALSGYAVVMSGTGTSGYSSYSGISGYSSYSGISGYSGKSGLDGWAGQAYIHTQSSGSSGWNITHGFGQKEVIVSIYDSSWNEISPDNIRLIDTQSSYATFPTTQSGYAVVVSGSGVSGYSGQVGSAPVGSVIAVTTEAIPDGFIECDGRWVLKANYPNLYTVLGALYGDDAGSWFAIPDFRGRFLRGWDHGAAIDPDRAARIASPLVGSTMITGDHVGTTQTDQFESHTHTQGTATPPTANGGSPGTAYSGPGVTGATGGNETRPVNTYVMYCIKY